MNFCKAIAHPITISLAKTLSHMAFRVPKLLSGRDWRFPPSGRWRRVRWPKWLAGWMGTRISLNGLRLVLELLLIVLLPKIRRVIRSFIFAALSIIKTQAS